jgi:uncharacterized protein YjbJ (UPF0337 family)
MSSHVVKGKWDQTKGIAKEFWGELTGDDLDFEAGQRERFIGLLEEKCALTRADAESRIAEMESKVQAH